MRTLQQYLALLGGYWQGKPKYVALMTALLTPMADLEAFLSTLNAQFDVDSAIGAQLDVVGQWVGMSRFVNEPLTNVYFSLDTQNLGFDQGSWFGPYDPTEGLTELDDDTYRKLIYAKIEINNWDGTLPGTVPIILKLFDLETPVPGAYQLDLNFTLDSSTLAATAAQTNFFVYDNNDMSITIGITGLVPPAVFLAVLAAGYLPLHPGGVLVNYYISSADNTPLFALDQNGVSMAGFDNGSWGVTPAI